jgi:hypothetical protein
MISNLAHSPLSSDAVLEAQPHFSQTSTTDDAPAQAIAPAFDGLRQRELRSGGAEISTCPYQAGLHWSAWKTGLERAMGLEYTAWETII